MFQTCLSARVCFSGHHWLLGICCSHHKRSDVTKCVLFMLWLTASFKFLFWHGAVPCFYLSTVVSLNSKAGFAECSYQTRHALNLFAMAWVTAVIPPVWLCRAFSCSAKRHFCWKSVDGKKLFVASDSTCRDVFFLELGKICSMVCHNAPEEFDVSCLHWIILRRNRDLEKF